MRFLHINTADTCGGAAVAMYRFHRALLHAGHESRILCGKKYSDDPSVRQIVPGQAGWGATKASGLAFNAAGRQTTNGLSGWFLRGHAWVKQADVIVARNLHGWYFSLGDLLFLARRAPVIWRLPDMWGLTGHCSYAYDCDRWQSGCGECPDLGTYPSLPFDTTADLWRRKARLYQRLAGRLVFVSSSRWLKEMVEHSPMTRDVRCELIPTGVDTDVFRSADRAESRRRLGIAPEKKVVMIGAVDLADKRKGGPDMAAALDRLSERLKDIVVLVAGYRPEQVAVSSGWKAVYTGYLDDPAQLASVYNAADVFLSLSRADNLPNTLVEAAACGVPVVCRDVGGCGEAVHDQHNGILIRKPDDAVEALRALLEDESRRRSYALYARRLAEDHFSMERQVQQYLGLAQEMIAHKV